MPQWTVVGDERSSAGEVTHPDRPSLLITAATATATGRTHDPAPRDDLPAGARVGRYVVVDRLGAGGMGIVYKAYDPELDRHIALKLLTVRKKSGRDSERARDRLLREAQALAQLSHPNVIAAYDVGYHDDEVYIAMELVEGQTLRSWLKTRPPRARILRALIAAGEGLAAAHAAGLVHRDFKPDNVLVGDDGRVRVLDFGLARAIDGDDSSEHDRLPQRDSDRTEPTDSDVDASLAEDDLCDSMGPTTDRRLSARLTLAGTVLGTPGYMAPEQYLGLPIDEHVDQFAYCVTLYHALYGTRPFDVTDLDACREAVLAGRVAAPPKKSNVPTRLRRLLLRGMSIDRSDRFPTMAALLDELRRDPLRRWRRLGMAAGVAAAIAVSVIATRAGTQTRDTCPAAHDQLEGVWDDDAKQRVRAAFVETDRAHAAETYRRVEALLDDHATAWVSMRKDTCEATHVRGEQSNELLDLRMICLDRRLAEFRSLIEVFATSSDAAVTDRAVKAAFELASLEACADTARLVARTPLPADADVRAEIDRLRNVVDRANGLHFAGRYDDALELLGGAIDDVRSTQFAPLIAEALHHIGVLQSRTGNSSSSEATLEEAMTRAVAARDDVLLADIALSLFYDTGALQSRYRETLAISPFVDALVDAAGGLARQRGDALATKGYVLWRSGDTRNAIEALELARTTFETGQGQNHPSVAHSLNYLSMAYASDGRLEEALAAMERAVEIWEDNFGPEHPRLIAGLTNLGATAIARNEYKRALRYLDRSLSISVPTLGDDHPKVAHALVSRGEAYSQLDEWDNAAESFARALTIYEIRLGPEHPYVAHPLTGLALCALSQNDAAAALPLLERSLQLRSAASPESPENARTWFALAEALWDTRGDRTRALSLATKARQWFVELGARGIENLEEVDRWLSSRVKRTTR